MKTPIIFRESKDKAKRKVALVKRTGPIEKYRILICKTCKVKKQINKYLVTQIYCSETCRPGRKKVQRIYPRPTYRGLQGQEQTFPKYKIEKCGHTVQLKFDPLKDRSALKKIRCRKAICR